MAGESTIPFTPGSGGKAHSYQRTIAGNAVDESVVIDGEAYLASYVALASSISNATANTHIIQLMAGASVNLRVRRIHIEQTNNVSPSAAIETFEVWRLSTAGTSGTPITPAPYDPADGPSGGTSMSLPTANGTEATLLWRPALPYRTGGSATGGPNTFWEWEPPKGMKPLLIAAGTANGIAVKSLTALSTSTTVWIEYTETLWL